MLYFSNDDNTLVAELACSAADEDRIDVADLGLDLLKGRLDTTMRTYSDCENVGVLIEAIKDTVEHVNAAKARHYDNNRDKPVKVYAAINGTWEEI